MAHVPLRALGRIARKHTQFAKATCATIGLKLVKIGAPVRIGVRRIKRAMAPGRLFRRAFAAAHGPLARRAP